ncbi:hypothetical protein KAR91_63085 [Candidatus Pacearchaeota archaeon]|nr:hypothetical protein [Candidatus Pacearchaeota archaeon]
MTNKLETFLNGMMTGVALMGAIAIILGITLEHNVIEKAIEKYGVFYDDDKTFECKEHKGVE